MVIRKIEKLLASAIYRCIFGPVVLTDPEPAMTHPEDQRDLLVTPRPTGSRLAGGIVLAVVAIVSFVAGWAVSP